MMSSAQIVVNPDASVIGNWMPHIMVFYPSLHDADLGVVASLDPTIPFVLDPGTPLSAMIVVMRDWVDPATIQ